MLDRVTAEDLAIARADYELAPWGERWEELHWALLRQSIAAAAGAKVDLDRLIPNWGADTEPEEQSVEDMKDTLREMCSTTEWRYGG